MSTKEQNNGRVYIMANPLMQEDLFKIGRTTNLEKRIKDLSASSGVPGKFECIYSCEASENDCKAIEKAIHKIFERERISPKREFFKIDKERLTALCELLTHIGRGKDVTENVQKEIARRRPQFDFKKMGINSGDKLKFREDDKIEVEVYGNKKVKYQGEQQTLSAVTKELLNSKWNVQPTPYWTYEGRPLIDIYNEFYPFEEE